MQAQSICQFCKRPITKDTRGQKARYCSSRCRMRACHKRQGHRPTPKFYKLGTPIPCLVCKQKLTLHIFCGSLCRAKHKNLRKQGIDVDELFGKRDPLDSQIMAQWERLKQEGKIKQDITLRA